MSPRLRQLALAALLFSPIALQAQAPVGELYSTVARVRGAVNLAAGGTTVLSGSSIESGEQPANLVLNRGGTLTICQGTSVAVSASANGRDLMFSFGSGTIESRYRIGAASDVIITPDLRLVLTGPGEFDLNIGISPQGDTCVQSQHESTAGAIISEQMGDGSYQIKPGDVVVFRKGRVASVEVSPAGLSCGCPAPKPARRETVVAEAPKPAPAPIAAAPAPAPSQPAPSAAPPSSPSAETVPADVHIVADAPFIFSSDGVIPAPTARVMRLHLESIRATDLYPQVQPPAKPKRGFWARVTWLFH